MTERTYVDPKVYEDAIFEHELRERQQKSVNELVEELIEQDEKAKVQAYASEDESSGFFKQTKLSRSAALYKLSNLFFSTLDGSTNRGDLPSLEQVLELIITLRSEVSNESEDSQSTALSSASLSLAAHNLWMQVRNFHEINYRLGLSKVPINILDADYIDLYFSIEKKVQGKK